MQQNNKSPTHPVTNPEPTFPFCPDQTDFLCVMGPDGFLAIDLNLIEAFHAGRRHEHLKQPEYFTTIQLTNNNSYESTEAVPVLVARYAAIKAKRYAIERTEREVVAAATPSPTPAPAAGATTAVRWTTPR